MAKFEVVGTDHKIGQDAEGKTYDYYTLHLVSQRPLRGERARGVGVETVRIYNGSGVCEILPAVGKVVDVEYNSRGRVEEVIICE